MQRDRALNHLSAVRRDLDRLAVLEGSWFDDTFLPDDRSGYRAEWDNTLDRFSAVVRAHAAGGLDRDVVVQLVDVARSLVAFAPSLERMQLRRPTADDLRQLGILSAA
jgi:hypothetical protein